ncbi:MAG TPA: FHA domain-containing protein [Anaerolineae bacterium]|nr:FHA domain-containing protein [Anaerolineae bacterium]
MKQQITIQHIDLLPALKFGFALGTFFALIGAVIVLVLYLLVAAANQQITPLLPSLPQVLVTLVIYIVLGAVIYGISVWLMAVIYNLVASWSGGLVFQVWNQAAALSPASAPMPAASAATPSSNYSNTPPSSQPAFINTTSASAPTPQPAANSSPWLVSVNNPTLRVALAKPTITIGSALGNDLVLASPRVAQRQAEIRLENGRHILYDLGTGQGTFVNGRAVQANMLRDGFHITFGDTEFIYQLHL